LNEALGHACDHQGYSVNQSNECANSKQPENACFLPGTGQLECFDCRKCTFSWRNSVARIGRLTQKNGAPEVCEQQWRTMMFEESSNNAEQFRLIQKFNVSETRVRFAIGCMASAKNHG